MKIIGLDLSITGTGFCCVHKDGELETCQIGTQPDFGHHMERIGHIVDSFSQYLDGNTICFVEDYAYGKSPGSSSLAMLAELGGTVKYHIWKWTKVYPFLINQSTVKKWLGAGNMKKGDMPSAAIDKYGFTLRTHDEYVALAIADIGCHLLKCNMFSHRDLNAKELEVMVRLTGKYKKKVDELGYGESNINRVV